MKYLTLIGIACALIGAVFAEHTGTRFIALAILAELIAVYVVMQRETY